MKQLSTVFFLFLSFLTFCQNYLDANPEWSEFTTNCLGDCVYQEYKIRLDGDTTINNLVYYKTKREGVRTTWDWVNDTLLSEEPIDEYMYPLREEKGKFFIFDADKEEEQLLHDFNLDLGDSAAPNNFCPEQQIVMDVDTIYLGSEARKKFRFGLQQAWPTPLIEGIGTSRGLFERPCTGYTGVESSTTLKCFTSDYGTIQIDTTRECDTPALASTYEDFLDAYNCFPNPFVEKIVVENKWKTTQELELKLLNNQGILVRTKSGNSADTQLELSTVHLIPGMYVLVITDKENVYSYKMLKI